MLKLIVTPKAQRNIDQIVESIIEYTSFTSSGSKFLVELYEKFDLIRFIPQGAGRDRGDGTREAFCRGYRIVYEIMGDTVYIVTVIHTRRLYPRPNTYE